MNSREAAVCGDIARNLMQYRRKQAILTGSQSVANSCWRYRKDEAPLKRSNGLQEPVQGPRSNGVRAGETEYHQNRRQLLRWNEVPVQETPTLGEMTPAM